LFSVFLGLWGRRFVRAEFQAADELLEQWSSLTERISDPGALVATTGYMRGGTAYFRGKVLIARTHFEQVLAHYHPRQHGSLAVRYGMYLEPALACAVGVPSVFCCSATQTKRWRKAVPPLLWLDNSDTLRV
jgi:hypothetical protein